MKKNVKLWNHFVTIQEYYLNSMENCRLEEAEKYWEESEDDIAKMPKNQQQEAKNYQFDIAEAEAEMEKTMGKKIASKKQIKKMLKLISIKMEENQ